ncbi:hypothetical protein EH228_18210 [Erwinia endophytica]|nr:hypothetical protein EH228_18210 [Erwinia endophytica]
MFLWVKECHLEFIKPSDLKTILHSKRSNIYYLQYCRVLVNGGRVEYVTEEGKQSLLSCGSSSVPASVQPAPRRHDFAKTGITGACSCPGEEALPDCVPSLSLCIFFSASRARSAARPALQL